MLDAHVLHDICCTCCMSAAATTAFALLSCVANEQGMTAIRTVIIQQHVTDMPCQSVA